MAYGVMMRNFLTKQKNILESGHRGFRRLLDEQFTVTRAPTVNPTIIYFGRNYCHHQMVAHLELYCFVGRVG